MSHKSKRNVMSTKMYFDSLIDGRSIEIDVFILDMVI